MIYVPSSSPADADAGITSQPMAARRLLIVMVVLLTVSTLAAALVPVRDTDESTEETTTRSTTEATRDPPGELVRATVDGSSSKEQRVEVRVGDQLRLRVTSRRPDEVEIPAFGELRDVARDSPALFDLLPFEAGTYSVRLVEAGRRIARIEVERRRRRAPGDASPSAGASRQSAPRRLAS
jgi:hypothetical protein